MADEKPTNPKDAVGIRKVGLSCVPAPFLLGVGAAMTEGALKYGRHNYREAGVRSSVYYDAVMRHMMAWWEGEDIDPESGLSHIVKAGAGLAVLHDSKTFGNLNDDRPPPHKDGWQVPLNKVAEALMAKYPVPKAAFTRKAQAVEAPQVPPQPTAPAIAPAASSEAPKPSLEDQIAALQRQLVSQADLRRLGINPLAEMAQHALEVDRERGA